MGEIRSAYIFFIGKPEVVDGRIILKWILGK
jgi:hypothetical protein